MWTMDADWANYFTWLFLWCRVIIDDTTRRFNGANGGIQMLFQVWLNTQQSISKLKKNIFLWVFTGDRVFGERLQTLICWSCCSDGTYSFAECLFVDIFFILLCVLRAILLFLLVNNTFFQCSYHLLFWPSLTSFWFAQSSPLTLLSVAFWLLLLICFLDVFFLES